MRGSGGRVSSTTAAIAALRSAMRGTVTRNECSSIPISQFWLLEYGDTIIMKKLLSTVALLLLLTLPSLTLASGEHDNGKVTLEGEILDLACYLGHDGAQGPDHAGCAKMCVKGGQPMGLLASDGNLYLLYAGHDDASAYEKTKEFAGEKVEVQGKPGSKDGMKGIEVQSVKSLK